MMLSLCLRTTLKPCAKEPKTKKYNFPYLYDSTQEIAKAFHAVKTPHAFIVANENGKYILKYSGGIDDNAAEPDKAEHHYVDETVTALLEGKTID
jgi:hypothetical protein